MVHPSKREKVRITYVEKIGSVHISELGALFAAAPTGSSEI
jgi:hypothetical protein